MLDINPLVNQLRATLSTMEVALGAVEDCIIWIDAQGRVKWCNAAFDRFLNRPHVLVVGLTLWDHLPLILDGQVIPIEKHPATIALSTRTKGKQCYDFKREHETLILEITWSYVHLGEIETESNAVLVLRNVTRQVQAERNLHQVNQTLEQQVEQRTQQLSEANDRLRSESTQLQALLKELRQTQAELIQAEKMSSWGQMVAGIAHEINNPVSFIHGNLTFVETYAEDLLRLLSVYEQHCTNPHPDVLHVAKEIDLKFLKLDFLQIVQSMQEGTERIRQIVVSLRNFARLNEAELKSAVDLHDGLENTLMILQHRLKSHPQIKVIRNYGELPLIECYAGQLNQVFLNLLSNAIDALSSNAAAPQFIQIQTTSIDADWVQIEISDTGTGMSEAVRSQIFNPFFTTKPVGEGTGMGLAISYQIVTKNHGGKIECLQLESGTKFVVQLPCSQT
ncbi:ATP-binding protein [Leptolyngbya sp. FACHB-17]|uniref:PAS domain-containing sensor histidine kinase n=1 Tax=unclassified Leptolyngbya TaxID=2650499 RepID=UPI0016800B61|nr:ATP-binding protein [Leptolyngbya sp. FACHB-17]MBD2081801.1 GHKL domain-containing protein [Leptolyngbya sp. FACHB-17]